MSKRAKQLISKKMENNEYKSAFDFIPKNRFEEKNESSSKRLKKSKTETEKKTETIDFKSKSSTREMIDGSYFKQLRIPQSYKRLEEIFGVIDNACSLLIKRRRLCVLSKLKEIVHTSLGM